MNKSLPSLYLSLVPLVFLVALVAFVVSVFGSDALGGASQVALILASALCVGLGMAFGGLTFQQFEEAATEKITSVSSAIIILLLIGALGGVWMVSGVVPTMIYYGLQVLNPQIFLVTACIVCAAVSVMTGSSWTTVATIGVAMMGIGEALGFSSGLVAGAIISGAYFGDKISPLSDTTVMASQTVGTPLFDHIRYMMFTTVPTFVITLVIFLVIGFMIDTQGTGNADQVCQVLSTTFHISPWLLLVPVLTGIMIARRLPSIIILFIAVVMACVAAMVAQRHLLYEVAQLSGIEGLFKGVMMSMYDSTGINTGVEELNSLVATRGMSGMMGTIWLIICAMIFGGAMTATRMLETIVKSIRKLAQTTLSMVGCTALTGIFLNLTTSDQYLSIILTSSMYKDIYRKHGYEPRLLSRTCEDSATVTSVLIPWNTCGMTQSSVLGVSALAYAPYCFFNWISPLMTMLVAWIGWKIFKTDQ